MQNKMIYTIMTPWHLVKLLINIFISSFVVAYKIIIMKKINSSLTIIKSNESDIKTSFIANSITLTPGTIAIEINNSIFSRSIIKERQSKNFTNNNLSVNNYNIKNSKEIFQLHDFDHKNKDADVVHQNYQQIIVHNFDVNYGS